MNTCETCKYWARSYKPKNGIADCDLIGCIQRDPLTSIDVDISVSDDSGLNFNLMTGKNFGCNQHKSKTP